MAERKWFTLLVVWPLFLPCFVVVHFFCVIFCFVLLSFRSLFGFAQEGQKGSEFRWEGRYWGTGRSRGKENLNQGMYVREENLFSTKGRKKTLKEKNKYNQQKINEYLFGKKKGNKEACFGCLLLPLSFCLMSVLPTAMADAEVRLFTKLLHIL